MKLEELTQKLVALAKKPTLTKAEHEESRELMIELKKSGLSNNEIAELSGGKWSPITVKGYTGGVKPSKQSQWPNVVSALTALISGGTSLEEVEKVLHVTKKLESLQVDISEFTDFMAALDAASVDPDALLQWRDQMIHAGLSFAGIKQALELSDQLGALGFTTNSLPALVKLAKSYGEPPKVMDAVSAYGSLAKINNEIVVANEHLENIKAQNESADGKLQKTEAKLSEFSEQLHALQRVTKLGYNHEVLVDLANLTEKYGGLHSVVEAINKYTAIPQIASDVAKADAKLQTVQGKVAQAETKYSHLTSAIEMCKRLLSEYKIGIDAIATILSIAKKFGSATEVLKMLDHYGNVNELKAELNELRGKTQSLKQLIAEMNGEYQISLDKLESLNAEALRVGNAVGKVQGELVGRNEISKLLKLIDDPLSAEYDQYICTVLLLTYSLRSWVLKN